MMMLKYVCLLCNLPAPVTVQEETVPAAELQKKQRGKIRVVSMNINLDFKYTQNTAPTKISTHGNLKIIASSK